MNFLSVVLFTRWNDKWIWDSDMAMFNTSNSEAMKSVKISKENWIKEKGAET